MKKIILTTAIIAIMICLPLIVKAESSSIGISPTQINIQTLKPGLTAVRQIAISRSDTSADETFVITTDNSEASDWLTFLPGKEISIAKGEKRVEVNVKITVPANALYQRYSPRVRIVEQRAQLTSGVGIQSGVILNFDLLVSEVDVTSLKVISAKIEDVILGSGITLTLNVENDGNVLAAPSKVQLVISDPHNTLLSTLESVKTTAVKPLSTESQQITFEGANLALGEYLAKLTVYDTKGLEMYTTELSFRVVEQTIMTPTPSPSITSVPSYIFLGLIVLGVAIIIIAVIKLKKKPA